MISSCNHTCAELCPRCKDKNKIEELEKMVSDLKKKTDLQGSHIAEVERDRDEWRRTCTDIANKNKALMEQRAKTHPRTLKLIDEGTPFLVVKCSEPYASQVANLIREDQKAKGTWTEVDQDWMDFHVHTPDPQIPKCGNHSKVPFGFNRFKCEYNDIGYCIHCQEPMPF